MLKTPALGLAVLTYGIIAGKTMAKHDQYARTLKFNKDNSFKIVTFSDLFFNDDAEEYLQTQSLIETVLNVEKPDLVVLTGDVVDPTAVGEYPYHFTSALELIKARHVPYVWTGGSKVESKTMEELHQIDYGFGMSLSYTGYVWDMHTEEAHKNGPDQEKLGFFTARIPIMDHHNHGEVLSVYTLDTSSEWCRDGTLPGETCITSEAIEWFSKQQHMYSHHHHYRDFVFLHKPVPEFMHLANLYEISGHKQQEINCHALNSGLFATALENKRTVWINSGFDADNDFSGRYHNEMMFSYARKSGFSGAGHLKRGARAFKLTLQDDKSLHGLSYVVEAPDAAQSKQMLKLSPPSFGFSKQTQCGVDPFATTFGTFFFGDDDEALPQPKEDQTPSVKTEETELEVTQ